MADERERAVLEALEATRKVFPDAPRMGADTGRRREEFVERAEEGFGWTRAEATRVYDAARADKIDPALALTLVRSGVAVFEPEPDDNAATEGTTEPGAPDWLTPPSVLPAEPLRRRRMYETFRRVRAHMDETGDAVEALRRFAAEEDVERCGY